MADLYLIGHSCGGNRLMIAPITSRRLARCPEPPRDPSGYFLMEEEESGRGVVTILAQIVDDDAAFRLGRLFSMA